ncbi:hypothetical protein HD806DRAFT_26742 [Xylariaceae sp. AK1471]|nr:hypothetical protein HD806DRAFT_26742 [Xylariaceae sp. AK1471]
MTDNTPGEGAVEHDEPGQALSIDPGSTANKRSLSTLYSESLSSYQKFLVHCTRHYNVETSHGLERCYEEYSRLKAWGHQKRAALRPSVPGSLAATLRDYPALQNVLIEIYEQIIDSFSRRKFPTSIMRGIADLLVNPPPPESLAESLDLLADHDCDVDGISEARSDISDDSSTHDRSDLTSSILKSIFENIEELYRLSSLIRRPRLTNRYLHSTQASVDSAHQQEYQHVRQKLLLWQRQQADENLQDQDMAVVSETVHPPEEETATTELIAKRQSAEETHDSLEVILSWRMAVANMKRRKQFRYWDVHPYRTDPEASRPIIHSSQAEQIIRPSTPLVEHKEAEDADKRSNTLPSTAFTFSTVARSDIVLDKPNLSTIEIMRTVYAPSVVGNYRTVRVPDIPQVNALESSLECPYCHMILAAEEMKVRLNWKRHVFRDLRPYICTFPDCSGPDRLFTTRHDWIYHEMQLHRRQWVCQSCDCGYVSKKEMTEHLRRVHGPSMKDRELVTLLEMSERPIDEAYVDRCPFCYGTMTTKALMDHIAGHMEELAIFALPQNHEDTEEIEGAKSNFAAIPQSERRSATGMASLSSTSKPSNPSVHHQIGNVQPESSTIKKEDERNVNRGSLKQIHSIRSRHSNQLPTSSKSKLIDVFYCSECEYGPWNLALHEHCQNCSHQRCASCIYTRM